MATAKKTTKTAPSKRASTAKAPAAAKPIKTAFNRTSLNLHIAERAAVEPKVVKAVLAALESAMLSSIHRNGLGEFTLPGLLKITALNIPAKKKRFGKDPFSGEERWFAPKPASIKIKARALKKLKDAAL
jgi:hypothetical protein